MKKTKKKHHALTEHYLIPAALFVLNICVVHVAYALSTGSWVSLWHLVALTAGLVTLVGALILKNRSFLYCSIACYLMVLTYWW